MDASHSPKTDQRASVRPISFLLDNMGSLGDPIMLPIRPEELTRTEPIRATVHQTLGREVSGWVDDFGRALPSLTISGTTGWGYMQAVGRDGFQSFEALNELVVHRYTGAKQEAIDSGRDPAGVKLLFVDLLDDFTWAVIPTVFTLRRSKSRPLLLQYNISLQALSTTIDAPLISLPFFGTVAGGLGAAGSLVSKLRSIAATVKGYVSSAMGFVKGIIGPIASVVKGFVNLTADVLGTVNSVVSDVRGLVSGVANAVIGVASDIAKVGVNVFRTISAIAGLPGAIKAAIAGIGAAFNEMACILKNSLRPRAGYEDYSGLGGASNCSSTTGGSPASAYAGSNAFALIQPAASPVMLTASAQASVSALASMDPVLAPMPMFAMGGHVGSIVSGVSL